MDSNNPDGLQHSADWIAYGLIDSIVDAFFPLAGYIDGAVDDLDSLTIDPTRDPRADAGRAGSQFGQTSPEDNPFDHGDEDDESEQFDEKAEMDKHRAHSLGLRRRKPVTAVARAARSAKRKAQAHLPSLPSLQIDSRWYLPLIYLKLFWLPTTRGRPAHAADDREDIYDSSTMLKSIANMRRLVAGLSRVLVGKHAVVQNMLKRASELDTSEVEAYLSDVSDHIIILQTSLYHYEYILSQCQPTYTSYIRVINKLSRGNTDDLILALSVVTISILPMQFITSMFSINVRIPTNGSRDVETSDITGLTGKLTADGHVAPFNMFICICIGVFIIACLMVSLVRYWRWHARVKQARRRGTDLPTAWSGYWGWA